MKRLLTQFKWKYVAIVVGLILAVVLLVAFNRRLDSLNRLNAQLDTVSAEGTAVMLTQEALLTKVAYATSDEAVEEWAYVDGRWVRRGEHPVVIIPAGNVTPTPSQPFSPQSPSLANWQVWWELFFGN